MKWERKSVVLVVPNVNKGLPSTYVEVKEDDEIKPQAVARYRRGIPGSDRRVVALAGNSDLIGHRMDEPDLAGVRYDWEIFNKF